MKAVMIPMIVHPTVEYDSRLIMARCCENS